MTYEDFYRFPVVKEGWQCPHGGGNVIYIKDGSRKIKTVHGTLDLCKECASEIQTRIISPYGELVFSKNKPKEVDSLFHNKEFKKSVTAYENLSDAVVGIYGECSQVYIPSEYIPKINEKVWMKCGRHLELCQTTPSNLIYSKNVSCESCKKDKGLIAWTLEEWQEKVNEAQENYDFVINSVDTPGRKFNVTHKPCGNTYDVKQISIYYKAIGCRYCNKDFIDTQEKLDAKLEGTMFSAELEDYRKKVNGRYKVTCRDCGSIDFLSTQQTRSRCNHCKSWQPSVREGLWLNSNQKGILNCGENTVKCMEHGTMTEITPLGKAKCRWCNPVRVVDTETMRHVLENLYGEVNDYSNTTFSGKLGEITAVCKKHNIEWTKDYHSHRRDGYGCPACGAEMRGWGRKGFYQSDRKSYVYLMRLNENYCKVGISNNIRKRIVKIQSQIDLEPVVIKKWEGVAADVYDVELHTLHRSGIPRKEWDGEIFQGYTEVFDSKYEKDLENFIDRLMEKEGHLK